MPPPGNENVSWQYNGACPVLGSFIPKGHILALTTGMDVDVTVCKGIFESDHQQVLCTFNSVRACLPLVTRSTAFNYKKADFIGLRRAIELVPWSVLTDTDIDEATDLFYCLLEAAIRDFIPVVTIKRRFPPWFDRDLRIALKEKEAAFERMKRNRCDASVGEFRDKRRCFKNLSDQSTTDISRVSQTSSKRIPKGFGHS